MSTKAVHISDIRSFRSCRRRWDWTSGLRGNLESIAPYPPFFTGRAVHSALEMYYQDKDTFEVTLQEYFKREEENLAKLGALWPQEVEQIAEQIDLIQGIMEHYTIWQSRDTTKFSDRNLEFVDMEIDFEVPLFIEQQGNPVMFAGRMDGLVKHTPTGEYWIWEAKTTRSIQELLNSLANDEQSGMYLWAARHLYPDLPIKGVLYNIMRKKAAMTPKMLNNGGLSKSVSIDTTSYYFRHCVKQIFGWELDETVEEEYGDFLQDLEKNDTKFFMRYPVYRSQTELDNLVRGIRDTAKEMLDPKIAVYPCPSWNTCNFCSFRSPCITMNAGGNYESLLGAEYQVRESQTSMRSDDNVS